MASPSSRPRRARLLGAATVLSFFALAATALAVPVNGRLVIPSGFASPAPTAAGAPAHYWKVWNGFVEPIRDAVDLPREVTIVLTGEGSGVTNCEYVLSGGDLLPSTLVVPEGQEVRITNLDGVIYELESAELPGFVVTQTTPGTAKAVTAPAGGPYAITDRNLAHLGGHIVPVGDLVACGVVSTNGAVAFGDVEPGSYTLKVFRGGELIGESSVDVTAVRGNRPFTIPPLNLPAPGAE